jgi:FSR family fosmidomycin resistance protein-like MFS transporter
MILSISSMSSSLLQPLFGYISDSLKRRFFIFAGLLFSSFFISLTGIAPNIWLLGFAIVLGNLGIGFYHPQATALVSHYSGHDINKTMGIFTACGTAGYAFGPVISSLLVENFGIKSTVFAVFPGLFILLLIYRFLPKINTQSINKEKKYFKNIFSMIVKNKVLLILSMISVIKALIVISYSVFMPFIWKKLGYPVSYGGFALASFSLFGGFASILGGRLTDTIGSRKVFLISLLPVTPFALIMLDFINKSPSVSFGAFALIGFFTMFSVAVNIVIAQKVAPENKGMISGIIGGFSWGLVGLTLTPLGFLAEKFGITNVLAVIAFVPLFGALLVNYLPDEKISG